MQDPSAALTSHPPASLREVIGLSFPFILVLFSGSLMGLCDRLILTRYSLEAVEASVTAFYLLQLLQTPCCRIASTAQIFVGQYKGAGQDAHIGPVVWQMIWFSAMSQLFILPLSELLCSLFFQNTTIETAGASYFRILMAVNFLFPLGAALSSYYLGQGRARRVLTASLASHILHLILDVPLIFGIKGVLAPGGVQGAAISAAVAQLFFCMVLFGGFLKPLNRELHSTAQFHLNLSSFWKCLRMGIPRAGSKIVLLLAWIAVAHIVVHKEKDYLVVLAFGGTFNLFYTCFNEGMSQALTTIGAYLIGAKKRLLWKLARSAVYFLSMGAALLAIPCLLYSEVMVALFFKEPPSASLSAELYLACRWLWLLFVTHGLNLICLGLLNAYGDTVFQMRFAATLGWMVHFLPVYFFLHLGNAPPNRLWLYMALACLVSGLAYFLRLCQEKWKTA